MHTPISLRLFALGLISCVLASTALDSGAQIRFTDATAASGIESGIAAHGVSVVDFDGDGDDDLLFVASTGISKLYQNSGDATFVDVTAATGLQIDGHFATGIWADINNDGFPDLFAGNRSGGSSKLFLSQDGQSFLDISDASGIDLDLEVGSATWGDHNKDGRIDLFIASRGSADALYLQTGDFNESEISFTNVAPSVGILGDEWSVAMQATWIDFDHDADLDLFCVHDGLYKNRMYKSEDLVFSNVAEEINIASAGAGSGMGTSWADVDGDGLEDVYITRIGRAGFFRNLGNGTFEDIAAASGAEPNGMSWGNVFEDFDLDGDRDLFVGSTYTYDETTPILYENDGHGFFTNVAIAAGLTFRPDTYGVASGDFNSDGLPDVVMTDALGNSRLLINSTVTSGDWIRIALEGSRSNRMAVGATVDVFAAGAITRRTLFAGDSYCSQSTATMHFGLPPSSTVDSVVVKWPSGRMSTIVSPGANAVIEINESTTSVGVDQSDAANDASTSMVVSPNPAIQTVHIESYGLRSEESELVIFDLLGRAIKSSRLAVSSSGLLSVDLDISELAPGRYTLVLGNGKTRQTKPLLVVR